MKYKDDWYKLEIRWTLAMLVNYFRDPVANTVNDDRS